MILNAHDIENSAVIQCDICIIGAGAAGITLAREFNGSGLNVWLLESGGVDFEEETQNLYKGTSSGRSYFPLDRTRLRYLGGTTNHWTGMCRPLDPIDFKERSWIEYSGWPISYDELLPWYRKAQPICELGEFNFDPNSWLKEPGDFFSTEFDNFRSQVYQYSTPTRFGVVYRSDLAASRNVTVCLHANVKHLQANNTANNIESISIASLDGNEFRIKSRKYILACGAIENARLLLVSNDIETGGLGNQNDLVGRFFMDHLVWAPGGRLITTTNRIPLHIYHHEYSGNRLRPKPVFILRDERQKERGIANYSTMLLANRLSTRQIATYNDQNNDGVSSVLELNLYQQWEQVPNPASRVLLSHNRDSLGMLRVNLDWELTEMDTKTMAVGQNEFAMEIAGAGLGRVESQPLLETGLPDKVHADNHQMGTTRMHHDPLQGVVNADCRVHGYGNLYVAGASNFPTCGCTNPTLTVVALALRLAGHLKNTT